jgi:hypothetical protein
MGNGSASGVVMANSFDQFPVYDPLIMQGDDHMSNVWVVAMSTFFQNLIGYLTQYGIMIPQITTVQRNTIQSPVNGQMIYNTTTGTFQGYQAGAWKTFTLT